MVCKGFQMEGQSEYLGGKLKWTVETDKRYNYIFIQMGISINACDVGAALDLQCSIVIRESLE